MAEPTLEVSGSDQKFSSRTEVLESISTARISLGPRPSKANVEAAAAAVSSIASNLTQEVASLATEPSPPGLSASQAVALKALKEDAARRRAAVELLPHLATLDLDQKHRQYEAMLIEVQAWAVDARIVSVESGAKSDWAQLILDSIDAEDAGKSSPLLVLNLPRVFSGHSKHTERGAGAASFLAPPQSAVHLALSPRRSSSASSSPSEMYGQAFIQGPYSPGSATGSRAAPGAGGLLGHGRKSASLGSGLVAMQRSRVRPLSSAYSDSTLGLAPTPLGTISEDSTVPTRAAQAAIAARAGAGVAAAATGQGQGQGQEAGVEVRLEVSPALLRLMEESLVSQPEALDLSAARFAAPLQYVPESLGEVRSLRELSLANNQLLVLPDAIGNLTALTSLDASCNQLFELPESIGALTLLRVLDLHHNKLEEVPSAVGGCVALEELALEFNQLKGLPKALGSLKRLRRLTLHLNQIALLPHTLGQLECLTELDVHHNALQAIPESIGRLSALEKLNVSANHFDLKELPESIGQLVGLRELDIRENHIKYLPSSITLLTGLEKLKLEGNPWRVPPLEVANQGLRAVMEYMVTVAKDSSREELGGRSGGGPAAGLMRFLRGRGAHVEEREKMKEWVSHASTWGG